MEESWKAVPSGTVRGYDRGYDPGDLPLYDENQAGRGDSSLRSE